MNENNNIRPFGFRDKIAYFAGDFGNNFLFMLAGSYLMVFYMRVLGINAAIIGTMFVVARFIDAFTDFTMGGIVDRAKPTKDGKFRPWIKRVCGPVALASFLMYQSGLADASMTLKIIYMFVTYILFGSVCYTAINIPYGSMASAITSNPKERSSLSTFRSLGGTFSSIIVSIIAPQLIFYVDANGNQLVNSNGFMLAAGLFSVLALISYIICYTLTTERVKIEINSSQKKLSFIEILKEIGTNRAFFALLASSIVLLLATMMSQSTNAFLYADYFSNKNALSARGLIGIPITLVIATVTATISGKFGKKEASVAGMLFTGIAYVVIFFLGIENAWVFLGLTIVAGIGMTYFNMVTWAMVTDVIDYQEIKTGTRSDGMIYGAYSLARKIGQALAGGIGGFALAAIGYDQTAKVQTEAVKHGIYSISTIWMGLFFIVVALILLFIFPLNKKTVDQNAAELESRRANAEI